MINYGNYTIFLQCRQLLEHPEDLGVDFFACGVYTEEGIRHMPAALFLLFHREKLNGPPALNPYVGRRGSK